MLYKIHVGVFRINQPRGVLRSFAAQVIQGSSWSRLRFIHMSLPPVLDVVGRWDADVGGWGKVPELAR